MDNQIPIIPFGDRIFPELPSSARFAILMPTVRTNSISHGVIGGLLGVANEELVVLIADNSEDREKRKFLTRLCQTNPNILAVQHEKDIGVRQNFNFVFDWSEGVEFVAIMADDDWVTPDFHSDAFHFLAENPNVMGASIGYTMIMNDNRRIAANQPQMVGDTPIARMKKWDGTIGRVTMYNASRRSALINAIKFLRLTPLSGLGLMEDLWELSRLATGDFVTKSEAPGLMLHFPHNGDPFSGEMLSRLYEHLHAGSDLPFSYIYFTNLGTAIQCALFLLGNLSPLEAHSDKVSCSNYIFDHLFKRAFLPYVAGNKDAANSKFSNYPDVLDGFYKYCVASLPENFAFDKDVLYWFIKLLEAFEEKSNSGKLPTSQRFKKFAEETLSNVHM